MKAFAIATSLCMLFTSLNAIAQNAADRYYEPAEMAAARTAVKQEHGSQFTSLIMAERLEYHLNDGEPEIVWDAQVWIGGDIHKFWFKTEGDYATEGERFEEAEIQALYSRAISPFWDLQVGVRHDVKPNPSRSYAVIGAQGLSPYWFALDGALFLSDKGIISVRLEAEYEFRLSQRLLMQPRVEFNAAFSDDEEIGIGSGLSTVEVGLRLRYEVVRELAPYIGVSWARSFGDTAAFQRAVGEDTDQVSIVAGVRFWF